MVPVEKNLSLSFFISAENYLEGLLNDHDYDEIQIHPYRPIFTLFHRNRNLCRGWNGLDWKFFLERTRDVR